jgi:hypothetical protein
MNKENLSNATTSVSSEVAAMISSKGDPSTVPTTTTSETKHPLKREWTFWFDAGNSKPENWGDNLQKVYTFASVIPKSFKKENQNKKGNIVFISILKRVHIF